MATLSPYPQQQSDTNPTRSPPLRSRSHRRAGIPLWLKKPKYVTSTQQVFTVGVEADGTVPLTDAHKSAILNAVRIVKQTREDADIDTVAVYGGLSSNVDNRWACYRQHACMYDCMYELVRFIGPGAPGVIAAAEEYLIELLVEHGVWSAEEAIVCNREEQGGTGQCQSPMQSLYCVCAR